VLQTEVLYLQNNQQRKTIIIIIFKNKEILQIYLIITRRGK